MTNVLGVLAFALAWLSPVALGFAYFFFQLSCEEHCPNRSWQAHAQLVVAGVNLGLGIIVFLALARERDPLIRLSFPTLLIGYLLWIMLLLAVPL